MKWKQICLVFTLSVVAWIALARQSSPDKILRPHYMIDQKSLDGALAELKAGDPSLVGLGMLGAAGKTEAIPDLKKQFSKTNDTLLKARIAQVLVQFKDADDSYWEFLTKVVEQALRLSEPDVFGYDPGGKFIPGPSPEFKAWVKANNLEESTAEQEAMIEHPGEVTYLGESEDRRAIPLLRRALESRNYFVAAQAALGLAQLQDFAGIPLIIRASRNAPAQPAEQIAQWLLYFDNPEAQRAFDLYVPKDRAKAFRDNKVQGVVEIR